MKREPEVGHGATEIYPRVQAEAVKLIKERGWLNPVKRHGPWAGADLRVVTRSSDPV